MADKKISELPSAELPLTGAELVPLVQTGIDGPTTVNAPISAVAAVASAPGIEFALLPSADVTNEGQRWFVTDLQDGSYVYGAVAVGGGSRKGYVFSTGSAIVEG
jgi:hypothetical protein